MDNKARRPLWAEVNLDILAENFRLIQKMTTPGAVQCAVVKANGYGNGAVPVARVCLELGAKYLAVAVLDEAIELRQAGINAPILVLGQTGADRAEELITYGVDAALFQEYEALRFSAEAKRLGRKAHFHLAVDSGMCRIGFQPTEESIAAIKRIAALPNVVLDGIFTHFCLADRQDESFSHEQFRRFKWFSDRLEQEGIKISLHHCCNSAAIQMLPEYHWDMVRPGIILYGQPASHEVTLAGTGLKPTMSLKCRVSHVKTIHHGDGVSYGHNFIAQGDTVVATLPVGYADGYMRAFSGKVDVLVHGQRAHQIGNICMDQCMIDVTHIPDVKVGDEVVLCGEQGSECITCEELADKIGTITNELYCAPQRRVPRVYIKDGKFVGRIEYLFELQK